MKSEFLANIGDVIYILVDNEVAPILVTESILLDGLTWGTFSELVSDYRVFKTQEDAEKCVEIQKKARKKAFGEFYIIYA